MNEEFLKMSIAESAKVNVIKASDIRGIFDKAIEDFYVPKETEGTFEMDVDPKAVQELKTKLEQLDINKAYVISVDVGDLPAVTVERLMTSIKAAFERIAPQMKHNIYVAVKNGYPKFTMEELDRSSIKLIRQMLDEREAYLTSIGQ